MDKIVLAVNPGSSSKKYALYKGEKLLLSAHYEQEDDFFVLTTKNENNQTHDRINPTIYKNALDDFLNILNTDHKIKNEKIECVGIRLVAPGRDFIDNQIVDSKFLSQLEKHKKLAPLHIKHFFEEYKVAREMLGSGVDIYAISDSQLHANLWHEARNYAIDTDDAEKWDIYRYGYHGISGQSVLGQLKRHGKKFRRLIICHLGSGSSIHAVLDDKTVDTTMGYSPLEGLVMATRSGDIDPTAVLHLGKQLDMNYDQLEKYLNLKSGLLGLGGSDDIRELIKRREGGDHRAGLALNIMTYRIRKYIGAYHAILGGAEAIAFTATVGERSAIIRQMICEPLGELGVVLDSVKNENCEGFDEISTSASKIKILVVSSDETKEIAFRTLEIQS